MIQQLKSFCGLIVCCLSASSVPAQTKQDVPPVVHSVIGTKTDVNNGEMTLTLVDKKQAFNWSDQKTLDKNINSPKSVNITHDGKKFYVNSLEGCATVVYDMATGKRLKVITYQFDDSYASLWSPVSSFFPFTHYTKNLNTFAGKPVESCFSHNGRYLWIPFYRRTYDINAQDPSALAVIDTQNDTIIKLMETGPLPKMIACSPDNHYIAVTHWGNNTVGLIDCSSDNPADWKYTDKLVIDKELILNFSMTTPVNRDSDSGYCLRGTVFTPDGNYLLVGCMSGANGIAVIDMKTHKYQGRITGMMANLRHMLIHDGWLYLSINNSGNVQRIKLETFLNVARKMNGKNAILNGWQTCKVAAGARTIVISPSGRYIFAACNVDSKLCIVDTRTMKMIGSAPVDSYPVGLDISRDGQTVIVTSQGRGENKGGNAVNIFHVNYREPEPVPTEAVPLYQQDSGSTQAASFFLNAGLCLKD